MHGWMNGWADKEGVRRDRCMDGWVGRQRDREGVQGRVAAGRRGSS